MTPVENTPLRICYFGTYRENYSRNQIVLAGLEANGVEVYPCHASLWSGIDHRVETASGGWIKPSFFWRVLKTYWSLFRAHKMIPDYDVMLIGYPGQFDTFLGRLLSWWRKKPMVLDLYMSLYLIAQERGLVAKWPLSGKLILLLERIGLRLPDLILSDTSEYIDYHCKTYGLRRDRFRLVPAGADDRVFFPRLDLHPPADFFRVIYYGTFIPNHGVPTIIQAANLIKNKPTIRFELFGDGPERSLAEEMSSQFGLNNVTFHGWVEKDELPEQIATAHVVLGAFGDTRQSLITIQNKIWESMAMARPVITGDAPTIRKSLRHRKEIYLVERGNPKALAKAIENLHSDQMLREDIGQAASERFQLNNIGATGRKILEALNTFSD